MGRLCERPGCSEPASVAYGMRAEDLVFWLDTLRPDTYQSSGVLCQRHADSMVVPKHWTLDDLRDPVPRLFRPPASVPVPPPSPRRRRSSGDDTEQLLLVATPAEPTPHPVDVDDDHEIDAEPGRGAAGGLPEETSWTPTFDESDDLDGLLSARSPLLARAFRGDGRPRPI
jgi:hypothetical protein